MSNYSALLKDPRWQKKRLLKLNESGFKCEECGVEDQELHIHHTRYDSKLKPWEYENSTLRAYCKTCHEKAEILKKQTVFIFQHLPLCDQEIIFGYLIGFCHSKHLRGDDINEMFLGIPNIREGIRRALGTENT